MNFPRILAVIFALVAGLLIAAKFLLWGYQYEYLLPERGYVFTVKMAFWEENEAIRISTWLPDNDIRQHVDYITFDNVGISPNIVPTPYGIRAVWEGIPTSGSNTISYTATLRLKAITYNLPDSVSIREYSLPSVQEFLRETEVIQVNAPEIKLLHDSLAPPSSNLLDHVTAFYAYVASMENRPFKGTTDAVTAALLEEASCNGKSRLLVALLRRSGIPSRLVGGVILTSGNKRTAHQWVEVLMNGAWVPVDPTNRHFAGLPENYLKLYVGDQPLFTHKKGMSFRYEFDIQYRTLPNRFFAQHLTEHPFNAYKAWKAFQDNGIPLALLTIVLMLPVGAIAISIFRNVIGMQTFGTFLPALIAAASVTTGLSYGLIGFLVVIVLVSGLYYPLERWHITHNPRMSIMMVAVVSVLLASGWIAQQFGLSDITYLALFPVAVLTITAERMAQTIMEDGIKKALWITIQTALVIVVVYEIMTVRSLQSLFLAFPELYLLLVAVGLMLGRWTGIRLLEYWRFRHLLRSL